MTEAKIHVLDRNTLQLQPQRIVWVIQAPGVIFCNHHRIGGMGWVSCRFFSLVFWDMTKKKVRVAVGTGLL